MVKILSIDGGGIRGILPGVMLSYIEEQLQLRSGDPTKRLVDYFDLIAGTSTGGILTSLYLCPNEHGRPKFKASQAVDLYLKHGSKIFKRSIRQRIKSVDGITDEKYSARELEKISQQFMGDTKLSDLLKPCLITSYDIEKRRAHFFTSNDAINPASDFYMKDVARATSAAPTYFECARIKNLKGDEFALVDGGVFANNPSLCAYSEARNMNFKSLEIDKPRAKQMLIVSLGTGSETKEYGYKKAKKWGKIRWIQPVIDIMMSGSSETVDFHLSMLFDAADAADQYIRIEPKVYMADKDMDNATQSNIDALHNAALMNVTENKDKLDRIVNTLL